VDSIDKEIKQIALPAIVTNISVPLMSMADVAVVGHIGAATYIGAVAVGSSVFNMVYWLLNFLRMGSSGMTAQAFGRDDRAEIKALFYRGVTLAAVLSVTILLFNRPIGRALIDFMDPDAATRALADAYFSVAVWGAPAVLVTYVLSGWLLGMQNSRAIMYVSVIINVINICLSVLFVFAFGWEIKGVAAATAVSQWLGAFALAVYIAKKYSISFPGRTLVFRFAEFRKLMSVNTDIFLRTLCLVLVTVWFTRSGARQGVDILSANALLMQLFTSNPETITIGQTALRIICLGFVVSAVSTTSSGALEGLGKGTESLVISLCRYLLFIMPLAAVLCHFLGANGVWHAFWITEALSALVAYPVYRRAVGKR